MIKSADFIGKLEQILLLNLSPKYRPIKSGDKIGCVTYKSRPIFCRTIRSADKIGRCYRSSVIGFRLWCQRKIKWPTGIVTRRPSGREHFVTLSACSTRSLFPALSQLLLAQCVSGIMQQSAIASSRQAANCHGYSDMSVIRMLMTAVVALLLVICSEVKRKDAGVWCKIM